MAIVIIRQDGKIEEWKKALKAAAPNLKVYGYLDPHLKDEIVMALVWKHPQGVLAHYKNLACIASFGAGVDFIFEDPTIDNQIPITRVIDPFLANDMSEFVIAQILAYLKNLGQYKVDQLNKEWNPVPYQRIEDVTVGIMGVGALGTVLAKDLLQLGFRVIGWANSPRAEGQFQVYAGFREVEEFLSQSSILVCLLPLTQATTGILNESLFNSLPKGAFLINAARGGHLVDQGLLRALDRGQLAGACLDVFHEEPLPGDHLFWEHPKIHITPHIASVSNITSVLPQLLENYRRLQKGEVLKNLVSREKQY